VVRNDTSTAGAARRSAWPVRLAYAYLTLPAVVFLVGWLEWWWLVLALAALGVGFWRLWLRAPKVWVPRWNRRTLVVAAVVGVFLMLGAAFSGVGGLSFQHGDHAWRNAIFEMLVIEPWPVVMTSRAGEIALTYYFGFWLPAALVGKAFGLAVGWIALLAWTGLGLAVFACLVMSLLERFAVWPVVVFAFFGGLDAVQKGIWNRLDDFVVPNSSIEFLDQHHLYAFTAFGDQLTTVFNQAIPAWVLTALIFAQRDGRSIVALCALASIQCPLPVLGAGVIAVAWVIGQPREGLGGGANRLWARTRAAAREAVSLQSVLIGVIGLAVFGSFFASSLNVGVLALQLPQSWTDVARLVVFWVFEFGIMLGLVDARLRHTALWWATLAIMLILPLTRFGAWNDLAMRAVIPAQVALFLMVCWTLAAVKRPWRSLQAAALAVVLLAGSGSVLHKLYFYGRADLGVVQAVAAGEDWRPIRDVSMRRLPVSWWRDPTAMEGYWTQYFGDPDSFFHRVLARSPDVGPHLTSDLHG
jgi:hypothetical protein